MNHRIEMEYNKLLQMAASGRLQQVELQRKRLQTLDRNEELLRDHWSKIDLLVALRQRDSQKAMQILQQVDSSEEMTFASMESTLRLAPEAVSMEFLEWCEAVLTAAVKKSPARPKSSIKFAAPAAVLVPVVALLAVVFGRGGPSSPDTIFELNSEELVGRVGPSVMLFCRGVEFTREEDGKRGWIPLARGSAWAVSSQLLVTNRHVVEGEQSTVNMLRELGAKPVVKNYVFPVVDSLVDNSPHQSLESSQGYIFAVPVGSPRLSGDHDLAACTVRDWTFDVVCGIEDNIAAGQSITVIGFPAVADELLAYSEESGIAPEELDVFAFSDESASVITVAADALGQECFFPSVLSGQISKISQVQPTFNHTAAAMSGASGSPIFDNYGNVVGIVAAGRVDGSHSIALRSATLDALIDLPR